jgi:hypothetical protein
MNYPYGYEVYKDVVIVWDEDHDPRIKNFIDDLSHDDRDNLIMCGESKGDLTLWWAYQVPESFQEKKSVSVANNDSWNIEHRFHWVGR